MKILLKFTKILAGILLLGGLGFVVITNYSVIFSKTVIGEVTAVEKIDVGIALLTRGAGDVNPKVFSFAIAIRDEESKDIMTASSEDRQWAVVQKGQCAEAVYLPYPPWNLNKKGTFFGARLIRLFDCPHP